MTARTVDQATAAAYRNHVESHNFLCGYRTECVWGSKAIRYLQDNRVGWGSFSLPSSMLLDGDANAAERKIYKFSHRHLRRYGPRWRLSESSTPLTRSPYEMGCSGKEL